ncbi:MAG TPA: BMP family protein [Candidatus Bathyarchaeia archaeon]|nr:BMP family protein [Candidatus Bathyarchaeia archaeon]
MVSRNVMIGIVAAIVVIIAGAGVYALMQTPPPVEETIKIAVLMPGSITDAGWNAVMYQSALEFANAMNNTVVVTTAEGLGQVGVQPTLEDYAQRGYQMEICWTIQYNPDAIAVAKKYPNTWFFVAGGYQTNSNVVALIQPLWEGTFLAGMVAAGVTNSNIIGAIAGYNYPSVAADPNAFYLGAKYINPAITALPTIFAGVWDDVGKGRESGEALIAQGADVLYGRGDGLTLGVIQAASGHYGTADTVYMVGDMADQNALASKTVITSVMAPQKPVLTNLYNMYKNGTLKTNSDNNIRTYTWGIKYGAVALAPFHGLDYKVPANIKLRIASAIAAIKAGTFQVILNYSTGAVTTSGVF